MIAPPVEFIEMVLPQDTNTLGTLLGGRLIHWMDLVAALVAKNHCHLPVVTVGLDGVTFYAPARVGDYVRLKGNLTRVFRTSMEIEVACFLFQPIQQTPEQQICQGFFTFVGLAADGKATVLPAFTPDSPAQQQQWEAAAKRREARLAWRTK
ncbi:acyl-CoA thioesterase [candidate division KSB1 bacterium]|nr:acyl-CoA thioesterase [candidate division KSB1 bacterium]